MSFFRNSIYDDSDVSFAPVFRFIDAFDNFQRAAGGYNGDKEVATQSKAGADNNTASRPLLRRPVAAAFNPRFDVIETKDAYELHGEIPGARREDVTIEFTEPQTIVIRGRVERSWSSGGDDDQEAKNAQDNNNNNNNNNNKEKHESHKATVSDEEEEKARENGKQVTKSDGGKDVSKQSSNRYWVQERSIGEFSRTFTFPVRVDEASVKAALNDGVLKVTVPKQEKPSNRRIDIL